MRQLKLAPRANEHSPNGTSSALQTTRFPLLFSPPHDADQAVRNFSFYTTRYFPLIRFSVLLPDLPFVYLTMSFRESFSLIISTISEGV